MTITPFQPELPSEGVWTDAELNFVDESPPGLYPENQDSNYGLLRKIFTDRIQELIEQQLTIYNERFVPTSTQFIGEWELDYALPVAPTNRTLAQRRSDVLGRISKGWFSRSRRAKIVEAYIQATFGAEIQLTPPGVALAPGGVPLYAEAADMTTLYSIRENMPAGTNFMPNGNFEADTSGWGVASGTLVRDTAHAQYGVASAKLTVPVGTNMGGGSSALSGPTAGRVFILSAWIYGTGAAVGKTWRIQFNESGGATVEEGIASVDAVLVSGWQRISCTGTIARNDRTMLPVYFTNVNDSGSNPVWIDGVQLQERAVVGKNLLANPSFESGIENWTAQSGTLARDGAQVKSGIWAGKLSVATPQDIIVYQWSRPISGPTTGLTYTGSMWVYASGSAVGRQAVIYLWELGGAQAQTASARAFTLVAGWQRLVVSRTLVADDRIAVAPMIQIQSAQPSDVIYIDAAQAELGSMATDYDEAGRVAGNFVDTTKTPYYYEVRIKNTVTPDMVGLVRELTRITPAGITFDVYAVESI